MITLEKLTEELDVNQIDEIVAGAWTTEGGDSDDWGWTWTTCSCIIPIKNKGPKPTTSLTLS